MPMKPHRSPAWLQNLGHRKLSCSIGQCLKVGDVFGHGKLRKPSSHKYPQRRSEEGKERRIPKRKERERPIFGPATSLFVGHRAPSHAPSSRLVAGPNLWPRHLRLFMRWLLAACRRRMGSFNLWRIWKLLATRACLLPATVDWWAAPSGENLKSWVLHT